MQDMTEHYCVLVHVNKSIYNLCLKYNTGEKISSSGELLHWINKEIFHHTKLLFFNID